MQRLCLFSVLDNQYHKFGYLSFLNEKSSTTRCLALGL